MTTIYRGYETIEHDWPRFYRQFADVYDRFSGHSAATAAALIDMFELDGKVILEVGCGTGIATVELARKAKAVIALEPEQAMMKVAVEKVQAKGIDNVAFVCGIAEELPLADNSVDCAITVYASLPHDEASRVVRKGGIIIGAVNHYRWYGGELKSIIFGEDEKARNRLIGRGYKWDRKLRIERGYSYKDIFVTHTYSSLEEAVETYGFIFGKKAIDYILANDKKTIRHKLRVYFKGI